MGDKQDGFARRTMNRFEGPLQGCTGDGVKRAKRLVHEEHIGICGQSTRDAHPLLLPPRELMRIATRVVIGIHRQHVHEFSHTRTHTVGLPAQQSGHGCDVVRHRSVGKQAHRLNRIAHASTQVLQVEAGDVLVLEKNPTVIELDHAVDHFEGCRFARP